MQITLRKTRVEVALRCMNKGRVVGDILARAAAGAPAPIDFVLCIGDDTTDEDMFATLREWRAAAAARAAAAGAPPPVVLTATVGRKPATAADAYCLDVSTVHALVARLAASD